MLALQFNLVLRFSFLPVPGNEVVRSYAAIRMIYFTTAGLPRSGKSQGKSLILSKSVKSQGILFSGLQFISFLQDFEMHFLSEKMKSILQSKESDQF